MASAVTPPPERLSLLSHCGTAVIAWDLSPTAPCPSTRRCSVAQAETRGSGEAPAARSKERRRVLPSSATTPGQPSAKWRMKPESRRGTALDQAVGTPARKYRGGGSPAPGGGPGAGKGPLAVPKRAH